MGATVNVINCTSSNEVLISSLDVLRTKIERVTLSPPANIYSNDPEYMSRLYRDIAKLNVNILQLNKGLKIAPRNTIKAVIALLLPVTLWVAGLALIIAFSVSNPALSLFGLGLYIVIVLEEALFPFAYLIGCQLWHKVKFGTYLQDETEFLLNQYPLPLGSLFYFFLALGEPERLLRKVTELENDLHERLDHLENPLLILANNRPVE